MPATPTRKGYDMKNAIDGGIVVRDFEDTYDGYFDPVHAIYREYHEVALSKEEAADIFAEMKWNRIDCLQEELDKLLVLRFPANLEDI